ncbi:MAG: hypothetical protein MUC63_08365 [Planctomycetes bacterium]|jgi:hypothetical protein|nr:hypothetical protein [Planctomycetota bacterium]
MAEPGEGFPIRWARPAAAAAGVAGALLRDGLRNPFPWAVAGAAGLALMAAALALPAAAEEDRLRLVASFTTGTLFLLAGAAGALLPAAWLGARRADGVIGAWAVLPGGRAGGLAGGFLASCAALGLWAAFLFAGQAAVVALASRGLPGKADPIAPRPSLSPLESGGKTELRSGGTALFRFPPAAGRRVPAEGLEGEAVVRLFLARPDSSDFGFPLAVRAVGKESRTGLTVASVRSVKSRAVAFRIPAPLVAEGFDLALEAGPSCFDAEIPAGGVSLRGEAGSPWRNLLAAALLALAAALFLAAVSAAGSAFLSQPVAVALAAFAGVAGVLRGPAASALDAWERAGLFQAKEHLSQATAWFAAYKSAFAVLVAALPDLGAFNRALDVAEGRLVDPASAVADAAKLALLAVPALLAAWAWRSRAGREP